MSKRSPRHWVGYLTDDDRGGLVLYDRESPDRSPHEVYLYHFIVDKITNHFKHSVRKRLRPLHEQEMHQVEKVKAAYLEYKLRYFRHLVKYSKSGFRHVIPMEFLGLSLTTGGGPWESFNGDPDWQLVGQLFFFGAIYFSDQSSRSIPPVFFALSFDSTSGYVITCSCTSEATGASSVFVLLFC